MKKSGEDKAISPHLQLPLAFDKTDPGDLKRDAIFPDALRPWDHDRFARLQQDTLLQINRMMEMISDLLENVHVREEVRNIALVELQKIKKAVAHDGPGSLISKQLCRKIPNHRA